MRTCRLATTSMIALAAAACSGPSDQTEQSVSEYEGAPAPSITQHEAAARDAAGGPVIAPTAAPGVAFNYRYAFRLPNSTIAPMQERHAAACEALGINRCRITGMRYRLVNETDIEAMLAFKLDPELARGFGREAIGSVTEAEGMLVDAEISGVDAGAAIDGANREGARLRDDIAALERRLATPGLSAEERVELNRQLETLRQSLRATQDRRIADEDSLATTPMVFNYGSGNIVPGFDNTTPLRDALRDGGRLFMGSIGFFIVLLGAALPFLIVGGLVWLAWRAARPTIRKRLAPDTVAESPAPEG